MEIVNIDPRTLVAAEYNPRKMTKEQKQDLENSIAKFGFVDPIIVNTAPGRKNVVVGGHQRLKIALEMGMETVPVYFVDLSLDDEQELNLRLNKNVGEFDWDILANFDEAMLLNVGFEEKDIEKMLIGVADIYTKKVTVPVYEPKNIKPQIDEVYLKGKTTLFIDEINASGLTEEEKAFLTYSAYRLTTFRYDLIADLYAHSSPEMKDLMERLALVIIDFDKAIAEGYVKVTDELFSTLEQE